jgi:hypothetical protein
MKLPVFKTLGTTFAFSLRHFTPFYLMCLLVGMPSFLYLFLSGQIQLGVFPSHMGWRGDLLTGLEIVLAAVVSAIMVWTLVRDRRNESWTVVPAIGDALKRLPTIMGVGVTFAVGSIVFSIVTEGAGLLHPLVAIILTLAMIVLALIFVVAMPCAAVENAGVADCFSRSLSLTSGSRLRIILIFILLGLPLGLAIYVFFRVALMIMQPDPQQMESLSITCLFLVSPALHVLLIAAPVAIHEQLSELKGDLEFGETAAVFD